MAWGIGIDQLGSMTPSRLFFLGLTRTGNDPMRIAFQRADEILGKSRKIVNRDLFQQIASAAPMRARIRVPIFHRMR
jgi:hypothetical protein